MSILTPIARRIAATAWMKNAMSDEDAFQVFQERPAFQVYIGIALILFSYVLGWPAVGALGLLAYYTGEPLILAIGGPLTYGLSHLVFLAGLYIAGRRYAVALAQWASRKALARIGGLD